MTRPPIYAVAVLLIAASCAPAASPGRGSSASPATISPAASGSSASPSPAATPTATPCASFAPLPPPPRDKPQPEVNGRTVDPYPYVEGRINVKLTACGDSIDTLVAKHGLKAPVTRMFSPPFDESDRRAGFDRIFEVGVEIGSEHREVDRLAAIPEDFERVTLVFENWGGVPEGYIPMPGPPNPAAGPPGTSFTMQVCCWRAGTPVTRTFVAPDGTTRVANDVVRDDNRVPVRWGGSRSDARGLYHVIVRGAGRDGAPVAARMRFAIGGSCRIRTQYIGDSDNAIYGHAPDRIELTFCNGRRPSGPELRVFSDKYTLSFIDSADRDGAAVYTFGVPEGRRPVDLVRELLRDDRVRSAAVVPVVPRP